MKNCSIVVIVLLLLPCLVFSQKKNQSKFEVEYNISILNTSNQKEIISSKSDHYSLNVTDAQSLITYNNGFGLKFNFHPKHAIKLGYGSFENGLLITGSYSDSYQLYAVREKSSIYSYQNYDLSYILQPEIGSVKITFEAGASYLKAKSFLEAFFVPLKATSYNAFFKLGVSKEIWKGIRTDLRLGYFKGLSDVTLQEPRYEIEGGFIPNSIGVEFSIGYIIPKIRR